MNIEQFHNILQHPKAISDVETHSLKQIVNEFPYFQAARALYLKKLKQEDSFKYNHNLKVTAAYTADRSILFDFITSTEFNQNSISEFIKENTAKLTDIDVSFKDISEKTQTDEEEFESHLKANEHVYNPDLFEEKLETSENDNTETSILVSNEQTIEEQLEIGKPLEFDKTETHSFSEWLNLTQLKPIVRDTEEKEPAKEIEEDNVNKTLKINENIAKKNLLIDAFMAKNRKLEPKKDVDNKVNLAKAQMIPQEELMTETLARIYLEQKNYKKAIQSYKILSLKYPEKSGFFADQIKAVKQLQENNN